LRRNLKPAAYELADPLVDLLPQVDVMRIERVVEVEDPGVDVGKGAGAHHILAAVMPAQAGIQYAAAVVVVTDIMEYWVTRLRG
jgi:hypothetical protein